MQDKVLNNTPADRPGETRTWWRRLTAGITGNGLSPLLKWVLAAVIVTALMLLSLSLHNAVSVDGTPGASLDIPKEWDKGWDTIRAIDEGVEWLVVTGDPFFDVVRTVVIGILVPFRDFLLWLPWWLVLAAVGLVSWRMVGLWFSALSIVFFAFMIFMGLYDLAMATLAITLTATLLCLVIGVPTGILAAKSDRCDRIIKPILDMMQTLPSFVYLIPALMLFGLGMTPAVMATFIYAVPPIIRLTNLGIRQVDAQVIEASRSFGTTAWQLLSKVQIPMALPTILAGLNQTVMMALAMVVIASMIGATGLGSEILRGISRLEVGRGFLSGISIVFLAIMLDRISQGIVKKQPGATMTRNAM